MYFIQITDINYTSDFLSSYRMLQISSVILGIDNHCKKNLKIKFQKDFNAGVVVVVQWSIIVELF